MGSHQAPVLRGRLSGEGQVESGHRLGAVGTEQRGPTWGALCRRLRQRFI